MTRDPIRYLQDSGTDPAMAELLRGAAAPLGLPVAVQARVGATLQNLVSGAASASVATSGSVNAGAKAAWFAAGAAKSAAVVGVASIAVIVGALAFAGSKAGRDRNDQRAAAEHRVGAVVDSYGSQPIPRATSAAESPVPTVSDLPLEADPGPTAVGAGSKQPTHGAAVAARNTRSSLAEEARLLEAVRMKMSVDPAAARRALAEYDAKFQHGVLKDERGLLAVKLALAEGRHEDAKQQAIQMEQQSKDSPYSKKAREVTNAVERNPESRTSNE